MIFKNSILQAVDKATFVKIKDVNFKDGIIELMVLSKLHHKARAFDRGFIGIAYRNNADNSKFECISIPPPIVKLF